MEKVVSRFRNRIITVVSIEFCPIENLWAMAILVKKVYDQEKPPIENIVELGKRSKIRVGGYSFRTKH